MEIEISARSAGHEIPNGMSALVLQAERIGVDDSDVMDLYERLSKFMGPQAFYRLDYVAVRFPDGRIWVAKDRQRGPHWE